MPTLSSAWTRTVPFCSDVQSTEQRRNVLLLLPLQYAPWGEASTQMCIATTTLIQKDPDARSSTVHAQVNVKLRKTQMPLYSFLMPGAPGKLCNVLCP